MHCAFRQKKKKCTAAQREKKMTRAFGTAGQARDFNTPFKPIELGINAADGPY
jgi:hypothetical protein